MSHAQLLKLSSKTKQSTSNPPTDMQYAQQHVCHASNVTMDSCRDAWFCYLYHSRSRPDVEIDQEEIAEALRDRSKAIAI